jgi:hypothetical protein
MTLSLGICLILISQEAKKTLLIPALKFAEHVNILDLRLKPVVSVDAL